MSNKIDSAEITNFSAKTYDDTAPAQDSTLYPSSFSITPAGTTSESEYQNMNWSEQLGYYLGVSELAGMIDRKAQFTIGKGYKLKKSLFGLKNLDHIRGNGLDSFNTIMYNAIRVYTSGGDFFAEIIKNSRGQLRNLKPLNPGLMKVHANSRGVIVKYTLYPAGNFGDIKKPTVFTPDQIFHLPYNRIADQIHGQSTIWKLKKVLDMRAEAMNDLRVVFHRYVKPLWIFSVDTDDDTEITTFKNKVDSTIEKAENMVVPKGTVDKIERIAIPQFATLDPLPWLELLQKEFLKAEGMPEIVMGGKGGSEAESKILYLAWQQIVEFNQMFLEEQIKQQLGLTVEFEFPASIAPELVNDEKKDSNNNKFGTAPGKDSK